MSVKKALKSKLLKAIRAEARRDKRNIAKLGNSCGEQDCSETNCSNYCSAPPHQDVSR